MTPVRPLLASDWDAYQYVLRKLLEQSGEECVRVCIHRGTMEIGGTCVEIESQGGRIVLDVGLLLDVADQEVLPLPPVKGFKASDPKLLGVVISYPHKTITA